MPRPGSRRSAVALRYSEGETAPRVVASGRGTTAETILEVARREGIPIKDDPLLVETLAALDVGTEIPPELYQAVAEALVWAYMLEGRSSPRARAARRVRDG